MSDDERELYEEAIEEWGHDAQIDMLVEECAELIQAVQKFRRNGLDEQVVDIKEELADVQIMIGQMELVFSPIYEIKEQKLKRLRQRLAEVST